MTDMTTTNRRQFEWRHTVSFEETNLVGNVYYARYVSWQGSCREMFLRQVCPGILEDLRAGLKIFTLKVECEYLQEITAFDEIALWLGLEDLTQTQIGFSFDYLRLGERPGERGDEPELIARGRQRVACMRNENGKPVPTRVPEPLRSALAPLQPRA